MDQTCVASFDACEQLAMSADEITTDGLQTKSTSARYWSASRLSAERNCKLPESSVVAVGTLVDIVVTTLLPLLPAVDVALDTNGM